MSSAGSYLSRQYHQAAARLAVDCAERRLQESLAAFVQSLDVPAESYTPRAESLSTRLAQLRQGSSPARTPAAATVSLGGDEQHAVRRAA